jgi:hypothetical protein
LRPLGTGAFFDYAAGAARRRGKPLPSDGRLATAQYRHEPGRDAAAEERWYGEGGSTQ